MFFIVDSIMDFIGCSIIAKQRLFVKENCFATVKEEGLNLNAALP